METVKPNEGISISGSIGLIIIICITRFIIMTPFSLLCMVLEYHNFILIGLYMELLGEIIAYIIIIKKICFKREYKLIIGHRPRLKEVIYVLNILLGYILVFHNSISVLISNMETNVWVDEYFQNALLDPIFAFISIALVAPIFEEIIFRGVILEQLNKRCGFTKSIIISSLLFGIYHGNIHQGINGFFIGLVLGIIYLRSGTLILSIFLHFINNAFFIVLEYMSIDSTTRFVYLDVYQLLIGIVILIIGFYGFSKIEVNSKKFVLNSKSSSLLLHGCVYIFNNILRYLGNRENS